MKKYQTVSDETLTHLDNVREILKPMQEQYQKQIIDLSKEEANLIALEYIEELYNNLCECRLIEGMRKIKLKKNK